MTPTTHSPRATKTRQTTTSRLHEPMSIVEPSPSWHDRVPLDTTTVTDASDHSRPRTMKNHSRRLQSADRSSTTPVPWPVSYLARSSGEPPPLPGSRRPARSPGGCAGARSDARHRGAAAGGSEARTNEAAAPRARHGPAPARPRTSLLHRIFRGAHVVSGCGPITGSIASSASPPRHDPDLIQEER